jgi:hypothetical protein
MTPKTADDVREGVLHRVERHAALGRAAMLGAGGVEALMLVIALRLIDWRDHTQVLIFVMSILGYTIVVLGLVALGAHVSRASARIVAVLESTLQR